jgi:hypothetical protein
MGLFGNVGWLPIDAAPVGEDVLLQVTDGRGEPYSLPNPCRLTVMRLSQHGQAWSRTELQEAKAATL